MQIDKNKLVQIIAEGLAVQTEIDNLGDNESVVFMQETVIVNLVRLAEYITHPRHVFGKITKMKDFAQPTCCICNNGKCWMCGEPCPCEKVPNHASSCIGLQITQRSLSCPTHGTVDSRKNQIAARKVGGRECPAARL